MGDSSRGMLMVKFTTRPREHCVSAISLSKISKAHALCKKYDMRVGPVLMLRISIGDNKQGLSNGKYTIWQFLYLHASFHRRVERHAKFGQFSDHMSRSRPLKDLLARARRLGSSRDGRLRLQISDVARSYLTSRVWGTEVLNTVENLPTMCHSLGRKHCRVNSKQIW